jgi:4-aminobutyrate--pyruvate transaminase
VPGDIVVFSPPLIISDAEIDIMFDAATKALDDTLAYAHTLPPSA